MFKFFVQVDFYVSDYDFYLHARGVFDTSEAAEAWGDDIAARECDVHRDSFAWHELPEDTALEYHGTQIFQTHYYQE